MYADDWTKIFSLLRFLTRVSTIFLGFYVVEIDIVVMDEDLGEIDFSDSTSKLGLAVQINSIAIDISNSMEAAESLSHEHFSIRGFVAGMRKKDQKQCFPFAGAGDDVDSEDNLPPLLVPEFRWWQCSSCIPKAEMNRTTEEKVVVTKSDANTSSCENVDDKYDFLTHRREKTCSKGKTYTGDLKARNSHDIPEVNTQQVIERPNNTPDASDMRYLTERPLCIVDEPDNVSSGSDGTFGILLHKRKPKLRSLADILGGEKNRASCINPRMRLASSCETLVASTDVDVSADVAKAGRSTERKRKIALREESEDREPLAAICPSSAAKGYKGIVLDGERKSRRVEFVDHKYKGGVSVGLDLLSTQRIKSKKDPIDTGKKMRRIRRDDEIDQMRECLQPNAASSANLIGRTLPIETNLDKSGSARSALLEFRHALVEMKPYFSSLSRQVVEKIDAVSMVSMPGVGTNDDPLISKSNSENCNIREKVALDLSLSSLMDNERNLNGQESFREHRCIPDLNMEIPEKTAMTECQQFPTLSETRSLPMCNKSDVSSSCRSENVGEGKLQMLTSEPNNDNNNVELGAASDDIPMEIVTLLARNRYEKEFGNSRRHLGINNSKRLCSAVNVNEHPGTISYPLPSRANGFTIEYGNMGIGTKLSTNSPWLKDQMDTRRPVKNQFRPFSSRATSQPRKPEYATPTGVKLWSSTRENVPFHLGIPRNHPNQPCGMSTHSFPDQDVKGKKVVSDVAKLKDGRFRSIYPSTRSLDPYSNDIIPAMQLLSLMDQRVKSGSFNIGTKSSLNKTFSPCKHHRRLNGKENHNSLRGPFFNNNFKDFSWSQNGVHSSGASSGRASSNLRDGYNNLEKRHARSNEALGDCRLNRNPADFSIPEVGNRFTLTAKDLKPRRSNALKLKPRSGNVDSRKNQRMKKNALGKRMLEMMA